MTTQTMIDIVDRAGLSVMNALALIGLPLVAIGLLAQAL